MKTVSLTKEELCLISIALNEYQMELDNYHLDEMKQISTKIDTIYHRGRRICSCSNHYVFQ